MKRVKRKVTIRNGRPYSTKSKKRQEEAAATDESNFLGYDPVNDVYKVLCVIAPYSSQYFGPVVSQEHQVFTMGAKEKAWRMIECKHPHRPATKGICRDGVVYYGAWNNSYHEEFLLVSFYVRCEDFGVINLPEGVKIRRSYQTELLNYQGKIALVNTSLFVRNFDMWVLQDVKKQEWSKISFLLHDLGSDDFFYTISTGEIIFAPSRFAKPFFLVYYDPKTNNAKRVDIEGFRDSGDHGPIKIFLDHVESPMFLQNQV